MPDPQPPDDPRTAGRPEAPGELVEVVSVVTDGAAFDPGGGYPQRAVHLFPDWKRSDPRNRHAIVPFTRSVTVRLRSSTQWPIGVCLTATFLRHFQLYTLSSRTTRLFGPEEPVLRIDVGSAFAPVADARAVIRLYWDDYVVR